MSSQQIYVSIELGEETHLVGKLWFHQRAARQSASFEYDQAWLKHPEKFALDPALQWRSVATRFGLSKKEINRMTSAFEHDE